MSPAATTARQVAGRLATTATIRQTTGWTPGDYAAHDAAHADWDDLYDLPSRTGMRPRWNRRAAIRKARRSDR